MLKKIYTSLLIIALLNLLGCYSSEVISRKDVNEGQAQLDFSEELLITTSDYKTYKFLPGYYVIEQDTLYGEGRIINAGKNTAFNGKIAMNEILSFEQEKIDAGSTIGLILGIAAVGFVAALLITSAAISEAFEWDQ